LPRWRRWWRRACPSSSSATSWARCCACRTAWPCCAAASWWPRPAPGHHPGQLAQWMVGHAVEHHTPTRQDRGRCHPRVRFEPGLHTAWHASGRNLRGVSLTLRMRRDRGHCRGVGQRPGGTGRTAVRHPRVTSAGAVSGASPCPSPCLNWWHWAWPASPKTATPWAWWVTCRLWENAVSERCAARHSRTWGWIRRPRPPVRQRR
jgi:hypothetical protein